MSSPDRKKKKRQKIKEVKTQFQARLIAARDASVQGEVAYIRKLARDGDSRVVTLGQLVFFSTLSGDAWMLDPSDHYALCLMREGQELPARIVETARQFLIEWDRDYEIQGEMFCHVEKKTGRAVSVWGYPTKDIQEGCQRALAGQ